MMAVFMFTDKWVAPLKTKKAKNSSSLGLPVSGLLGLALIYPLLFFLLHIQFYVRLLDAYAIGGYLNALFLVCQGENE